MKRFFCYLCSLVTILLLCGFQLTGSGISGGAVTITNVTVYANARVESGTANFRLAIRPNGAAGTTYSADKSEGTSYAEISESWATNPYTTTTWTTADINGTRIGLQTRTLSGVAARCTQLWMVVTFSDTSSQTLRPNLDSDDGSWVPFASSNVYEEIDEAVSDDDTTYDYTSTDFSVFLVQIGDLP